MSRRGKQDEETMGQSSGNTEEISLDFTPEELREFLQADGLEVHADPEFKESLRLRLWEMLRARRRRRDGEN